MGARGPIDGDPVRQQPGHDSTRESQIRQATEEDLPVILELLEECRLPTDDVPAIVGSFFTAQADAIVVGVVALERFAKVGLLRSLAVPPRFRKHGIGLQLCDHVIDTARAQGLADVYLLTTDADGYFNHLGFHLVDRTGAPEAIRATRQFRELCPDSAKLMHRGVDRPEPKSRLSEE